MLPSKSKWNYSNIPNDDSIQWTKEEDSLSPVIKELLVQRGIKSSEEAHEFLTPSIDRLHDPKNIHGIDIACERVHQAIQNEEKILIFGDYDADGVSSTTVLLKALQELGANCDFYIPNRFTEGYGPNELAFKNAHENGFRLIITVDTGIASVHEANVAKELGIDLIITDHHEPQEELPDALAVIHPKCSPDYPFKELAGVGVAFKFAQELLGYFPEQLLDLVAIGTIADLVPLVDENRILAYYGLKKLTNTNRQGLKALMELSRIEGKVTEESVGFSIGPRLNAVGRLQDADLAVQLLITDDKEEAKYLAEEVDALNQERQDIVKSIVDEVDNMIHVDDNQGVIVVSKAGWNEGVLGIVASRLVRKYDRPAIVLAINEETNTAKGSARSIPAFDLFQNCMKVRELFTHFGGHSQAAGMTLPLDNVETLQDKLNQIIFEQLSVEDFKQEVEVSKTLGLPEVNEALIEEINQLAPFGMANPKPVFHLSNIPSDVRQLGNGKNHLKLQFKQDSYMLEGIGFGFGYIYPLISPKTPVSIVGELSINEWNGYRKPQIVIQDVKIDEWQLFDHRGKKNIEISTYFDYHSSHVVLVDKVPDNVEEFPSHVSFVTYDDAVDSINSSEVLYVMDLPKNLDMFKRIVQKVNPENIHVSFQVENSTYLSSMPSREDFKWFYALIWKQQELDLKQQLNRLMQTKNWSKDAIIFMSKVFFELDFVMIDNGIIKVKKSPVKKDLQESKLYQERLNQSHIEKVLYYSTYNELRNWFLDALGRKSALKEEVVHGL
ncbi:single-stranded-DNA-specific exonuclease RecJ [Ornithinibacillus halophilus]|uniref:Single-stranded-DNA-specific exonuclease RecJ n=1 Tax=Ornithinibacillus halophilus TaxID=930117 RepID=A0A1M5DGZ4_9BACI|nr:single-stranded-DNA-specific exonuclease RecJ [Ornithinibacillus halophilus]SHF66186.1 exonuclease RecJ [Ornithinibacillus halophilus]